MERRPEQLSFSFTYPPEHYHSELEEARAFRNSNRKISIPALGIAALISFFAVEETNQMLDALPLVVPFLLLQVGIETSVAVDTHRAKKRLRIS